jgi:hypothetical protein
MGTMLTRRSKFFGVFLIAVLSGNLWAATYYISPTGDDTTGSGTSGAPYHTMDKAFTVGAGGDTYIYKNGTYDYAGCELNSNVKSGSVGAFTVIKAETDGGALITQTSALAFPHSSLKSYVQVEGLKFTGSYQKDIQGYHLKFLRCAFKGGPASGNTVGTMIGSNDYTPVSSDVLVEDCWFYGQGGRYNLLVFNAEKVILRRIVGRHEGGWDDGVTVNPEAVFTVYNSSDVRVQDGFAIDSTSGTFHTFESYSDFYLIHNSGANPDHAVKNLFVRGAMSIETVARCFLFEGPGSTSGDFQGSDLVCVNSKQQAIEFPGDGNTTSLDRVGVIYLPTHQVAQTADRFALGYFGSGGAVSATNVISSSMTGQDFQGVSVTYFDTFQNGTNAGSGTGRQTYNPRSNGWLYPMRIETASNLANDGTGGQIGPKITTKWGTTGSMWGETGYDSDSGVTLWPYPNESRIKTDFCEESTWGWCGTASTLTTYLFQKFGNTIPSSIYAASTPAILGNGFKANGIRFVPQ